MILSSLAASPLYYSLQGENRVSWIIKKYFLKNEYTQFQGTV